jgi:hypothetical protein
MKRLGVLTAESAETAEGGRVSRCFSLTVLPVLCGEFPVF